MIRGTITAKHILTHPIMLIGIVGLLGYIRLIFKCVGSTSYCFTDFILK